jgi:hypothetical protein
MNTELTSVESHTKLPQGTPFVIQEVSGPDIFNYILFMILRIMITGNTEVVQSTVCFKSKVNVTA